MWPKIINYYSQNFNIPKRSKKIKHIIIHYTGMKKESLAITIMRSKIKCECTLFYQKWGYFKFS